MQSVDMEISSASPFDLLLGIDRKSRQRAHGFPVEDEAREEWLGVAFQVRDTVLLAPMDEVAEIVKPMNFANVPGAKPWVLGIANMRGNLLPVIDLQGFLYDDNSVFDPRHQRILVIEHAGVTVGLLVEAIHGLKRFYVDEVDKGLPELDGVFKPYVERSFTGLGERYAVFSVYKLIEDEIFLDVAV